MEKRRFAHFFVLFNASFPELVPIDTATTGFKNVSNLLLRFGKHSQFQIYYHRFYYLLPRFQCFRFTTISLQSWFQNVSNLLPQIHGFEKKTNLLPQIHYPLPRFRNVSNLLPQIHYPLPRFRNISNLLPQIHYPLPRFRNISNLLPHIHYPLTMSWFRNISNLLPQIQNYYHSSKITTTVSKLLPQFQNYYHRSKITTTVPKLLPQTQNYYHRSITTTVPKLLSQFQNYCHSFKRYHSFQIYSTVLKQLRFFPQNFLAFLHSSETLKNHVFLLFFLACGGLLQNFARPSADQKKRGSTNLW